MPFLRTTKTFYHAFWSFGLPVVRLASVRVVEVEALLVQVCGRALLSESANPARLVSFFVRPRTFLCPLRTEMILQQLPRRCRGLVLHVTSDRRLKVGGTQLMLPFNTTFLREEITHVHVRNFIAFVHQETSSCCADHH